MLVEEASVTSGVRAILSLEVKDLVKVSTRWFPDLVYRYCQSGTGPHVFFVQSDPFLFNLSCLMASHTVVTV